MNKYQITLTFVCLHAIINFLLNEYSDTKDKLRFAKENLEIEIKFLSSKEGLPKL